MLMPDLRGLPGRGARVAVSRVAEKSWFATLTGVHTTDHASGAGPREGR